MLATGVTTARAADDANVAAHPASAELKPAEPVESSAVKNSSDAQPGIWGRPVRRGGFHFQIGFGIGGGPDTSGLFHTMELGWTFGDYTVALLHTFIQNKGILGTNPNEPDLIGGWMAEFKMPIVYRDLDFKVAAGLGGTHDQSNGITVHAGPGFSYGVDLHFPIWERFGPTLTLAGMNVWAQGQHHFGAGAALGVTLF
jgi:hypothetical protein